MGNGRVVTYIAGMVAAFCMEGLALGLYVLAALMWLIPDRRIARVLEKN